MNDEVLALAMDQQNTANAFLFEEETYAIRGAIFEVYREMG